MIKQTVEKYTDYSIKIRRHLHSYPEVSGQEFNTTKFLQEEVRKLGLPIETIPTNSFIATLDTGRPGLTIGLRTDIDALPIKEHPNNLKGPREIISQVDGAAHLCGHDGHCSILLTTMKALIDLKDQLSGKIIFIFEEGEEQGTGINAMIEYLKNKEIDLILGNHLANFLETGQFSVKPGPTMSGAAAIDFKIIGKSGHASRPDLSINPIFALGQILNGLTSAWVNQIHPSKTVTLAITRVEGGSAFNVIPDEVRVSGTCRYFDMDEGVKAINIAQNIIEKTAELHGCSIEFLQWQSVLLPPVYNDELLTQKLKDSIQTQYPSSEIKEEVWFASESFARYSELCPSVYYFVGTKNDDVGSGAEHHNQHFDIDEASIQYASRVMTQFVVDQLRSAY